MKQAPCHRMVSHWVIVPCMRLSCCLMCVAKINWHTRTHGCPMRRAHIPTPARRIRELSQCDVTLVHRLIRHMNADRIKHHGCWLLQLPKRARGVATTQQRPHHTPNTAAVPHDVATNPSAHVTWDVAACMSVKHAVGAWSTVGAQDALSARRAGAHDGVPHPAGRVHHPSAPHRRCCIGHAY